MKNQYLSGIQYFVWKGMVYKNESSRTSNLKIRDDKDLI